MITIVTKAKVMIKDLAAGEYFKVNRKLYRKINLGRGVDAVIMVEPGCVPMTPLSGERKVTPVDVTLTIGVS